MTRIQTLTMSLAIGALSAFSLGAAAQSIDVKCETRSDRSKASVDGKNLSSGNYSAVLISGANSAQSPYEATVGDEAEFDFDSNARDIRQGATAIPRNFIVGNRVTAMLLDVGGNVVAQRSAKCRRN